MEGESAMIVREEEMIARQYPVGMRFRPTDEELVVGYLRHQVRHGRLPSSYYNIPHLRVYDYSPFQLYDTYGMEGEPAMYFFNYRVRKYPNGRRSRRDADGGFWNPTGCKVPVGDKNNPVGCKTPLVFYQGMRSSKVKTDWLMHEYTLVVPSNSTTAANAILELDTLVLCKIYKKKTKSENKDANPGFTPPLRETNDEQLPSNLETTFQSNHQHPNFLLDFPYFTDNLDLPPLSHHQLWGQQETGGSDNCLMHENTLAATSTSTTPPSYAMELDALAPCKIYNKTTKSENEDADSGFTPLLLETNDEQLPFNSEIMFQSDHQHFDSLLDFPDFIDGLDLPPLSHDQL